jgi:hypothetical protein
MQFSKSESPKAQTGCLWERIASQVSGADRDRTDDIQLAKLALSQLSYSPFGRTTPYTRAAEASRF